MPVVACRTAAFLLRAAMRSPALSEVSPYARAVPAGPCGPVEPAGPAVPIGPVAPACPAGPGAPAWPFAPFGPLLPFRALITFGSIFFVEVNRYCWAEKAPPLMDTTSAKVAVTFA